jgi:CarD family transcriptional regulator
MTRAEAERAASERAQAMRAAARSPLVGAPLSSPRPVRPEPATYEIPIPPPPKLPAATFNVGDKAVHPAHGVGEVMAIEKREIGGTTGTFYILRILDNGMKVMVPTNASAQVGLREIMSSSEADAILETMRAKEVAVDVQPWSRRFRIYTEMIKSKSPHEVAKVLRDMHRLKFDKDLSFGERRLLDQAKSLLMKELSLAKGMSESDLETQVQAIFSA